MRIGYQHPARYINKKGIPGQLKFHMIGCRVDGGPGLPPGKCEKCGESVEKELVRFLASLDARSLKGPK